MSLNNVENMETAKSNGNGLDKSVTPANETTVSTSSSLAGESPAPHHGTSKRATMVSILALLPGPKHHADIE